MGFILLFNIDMFWGGIEPPHYDFQSYALPFKLPKLSLPGWTSGISPAANKIICLMIRSLLISFMEQGYGYYSFLGCYFSLTTCSLRLQS